jgi:hypothetical protein
MMPLFEYIILRRPYKWDVFGDVCNNIGVLEKIPSEVIDCLVHPPLATIAGRCRVLWRLRSQLKFDGTSSEKLMRLDFTALTAKSSGHHV